MFEVRPFSGNPAETVDWPNEIPTAYGFNNINFGGVVGNGSGETIAIGDAYDDPNIQTDLNSFDEVCSPPTTTVTRVNETGGTSLPSTDPTGDWEIEESLDVEWAHAIAPGAKILLVEAGSPSNTDMLAPSATQHPMPMSYR